MLNVRFDTFQPYSEDQKTDYERKYSPNLGTVEVEFLGKARRVRCLGPVESDGDWIVSGLCARYATGTKVWSATVVVRPDGRIGGVFTGFESRSGRHSQPRLCGFLADVGEQHVSKR